MSAETNRLLSNLKDIMYKVWKKLCDGIPIIPPEEGILIILPEVPVEGQKCDDTKETETANGIFQTIPHPDYVQRVQICKTGIDPEPVCLSNDGGVTVITGWEVFDTSTNPPTSKLYVNGVEVTGYEVVPCDPGNQYDYEHKEVCVDGERWVQVFVWNKKFDGIPNLETILWIDATGTVVTAPDPALINNANCNPPCLPEICSATGDDLSTLCPGHNFSFIKPDCCKLKVTTSIGTFIIPKRVQSFSTSDFDCTFEVTNVEVIEGTCDLSKVDIMGSKLR